MVSWHAELVSLIQWDQTLRTRTVTKILDTSKQYSARNHGC